MAHHPERDLGADPDARGGRRGGGGLLGGGGAVLDGGEPGADRVELVVHVAVARFATFEERVHPAREVVVDRRGRGSGGPGDRSVDLVVRVVVDRVTEALAETTVDRCDRQANHLRIVTGHGGRDAGGTIGVRVVDRPEVGPALGDEATVHAAGAAADPHLTAASAPDRPGPVGVLGDDRGTVAVRDGLPRLAAVDGVGREAGVGALGGSAARDAVAAVEPGADPAAVAERRRAGRPRHAVPRAADVAGGAGVVAGAAVGVAGLGVDAGAAAADGRSRAVGRSPLRVGGPDGDHRTAPGQDHDDRGGEGVRGELLLHFSIPAVSSSRWPLGDGLAPVCDDSVTSPPKADTPRARPTHSCPWV